MNPTINDKASMVKSYDLYLGNLCKKYPTINFRAPMITQEFSLNTSFFYRESSHISMQYHHNE